MPQRICVMLAHRFLQHGTKAVSYTHLGPVREKGKEFALPTFGSGKVKVKDIAIFFRQFSVMIDAGLPLVQCLEILAANQENPSFQKTLNGVRSTVEGGATLANAMRLYLSLIHI